jgi:hypothetical protein
VSGGEDGAGRLEELGIALLPDQAPDGADNDGVVVDAELGSNVGPDDQVGLEPVEVDAVAEDLDLAPRHPESQQCGGILFVLHQLGVGEQGGDPLEHVHGELASPPVLRLRVEAVLGVHHQRHPGRSGGDASVDAGLGVVRVDDVGAEPPEEAVELEQRLGVAAQVGRSGGVAQGVVHDAVGLEGGHVGPGRGGSVDVVAGGLERTELRPEEQLQADVGGGDVEQLRHAAASAGVRRHP